jgi:uncharacterized Zn-binding protein involved in type VI secretion
LGVAERLTLYRFFWPGRPAPALLQIPEGLKMVKPVCLGDPTSHGGFVKTASSTFELEDGRNVALIYDIVSCPQHGDNPIIESDGYEEDGRKWVMHGCKSKCGSIVRATTKAFEIE